ncbi:YkvA family protein [Mesorhizobium sp. KR1-2]|uniref:YkvA family protein n=1 Tax=Mesorhizobium sp. KR1-2 TaxID=3156609 RepID=UPI0032B358CC
MTRAGNFESCDFASDEKDVRDKFWRTARKAARHIPFMEDVVAAYYCALDKQTPLRAKGILLAALAYFVLPVDAIPDMIFGIGFTDDIAVLTAAIAAVRSNITPAHRLAAREALARLD